MLRIVDARAGGDVTRVIIEGAPDLHGETAAEKCADFARSYDHLRLKLIHPPVGALHMCPVLLLPPRGEADFGVIIMESMGYPPISGSNLLCATAVALEYGFAPIREPETALRVEAPAGIVAIAVQCRDGRCRRVEFENTPARIKSTLDAPVDGADGRVSITTISAGVDYAVVSAESLDIALTPDSHDRLLALGKVIADAAGTDFALFFRTPDPNREDLGCTMAVFQSPGVICRSPTGTGTSALLTLLHSRGRISPGQALTTRSPAGNEFIGRILSVRETPTGPLLRTVVGGEVTIDDESVVAC